MAEYIEREAALKAIDEYFHTTNPDGEEQIGVLKSRRIIRTFPAADVEVVVRCGECGHCEAERKRNGEVYFYRCGFFDIEIELQDFCSYGERRK